MASVALLVRSWNVFHGNTQPVGRRSWLEAMVRLVSADSPDVVCLQELGVWSLARLERWSGLQASGAVSRRPRLPARLAGGITRLDQGLFRSALEGQAQAILTRGQAEPLGVLRVSEGLREVRVVNVVRYRGVVIGNVHATNDFRDPGVPRAEVERASAFLDSLARSGEPRILAGDFNLRDPALPGPELDHVLVVGATMTPLVVWPTARRSQNGVVFSDHAPVELTVG